MSVDVDKWLEYQPSTPKKQSSLDKPTVISIFNQKGGVGKTTSTISIAAALADFGRKVLVVDFDPQGSLTVGLTGIQDMEPTIYEAILGHAKASDIMLKTNVPGVDLIPANIHLASAEIQLFQQYGREFALQKVLSEVIADYDYVLIDCLPSLGLLAVNALSTSDWILIPMQCEFYSMKGIGLLDETLDNVRSRINPKLKVLGMLPTMVGRSGHHRQVLERVIEEFGDLVFHTTIPETIKFSESTVASMPITTYAAKSPAANSYIKAAAELIERIEKNPSVEIETQEVVNG
jgi:chromosome partitioning protein